MPASSAAFFSLMVRATSAREGARAPDLNDAFAMRDTSEDECYDLEWVFAVIKTMEKFCRSIEVFDDAMKPVAISGLVRTSEGSRCCLRLSASDLALRFACLLFRDEPGWNEPDFYFEDESRDVAKVSARPLPSEPVCSRAFAVLGDCCKTIGEKRSFWRRVTALEELMFAVVAARLSARTDRWSKVVLTTNAGRIKTLKTVIENVKPVVAKRGASANSSRAQSPTNAAPLHPSPPRPLPPPPPTPLPPPPPAPPAPPLMAPLPPTLLRVSASASRASLQSLLSRTVELPVQPFHEELRKCNFPPRRGDSRVDSVWRKDAPTGVIFGPPIDEPDGIVVPRGMQSPTSTLTSIW